MIENGQKWSKMVKMVKNGQKWSKMVKMAGVARSRMVEITTQQLQSRPIGNTVSLKDSIKFL